MSLKELFEYARETGSLQLSGQFWSEEITARLLSIDFPLTKISFPRMRLEHSREPGLVSVLVAQPTLKTVVINDYVYPDLTFAIIQALSRLPNLSYLDITGLYPTTSEVEYLGRMLEYNKKLRGFKFNVGTWYKELRLYLLSSFSLTWVDQTAIPGDSRREISLFLQDNKRRLACKPAVICWILIGKSIGLHKDVIGLIAKCVWESRRDDVWE